MVDKQAKHETVNDVLGEVESNQCLTSILSIAVNTKGDCRRGSKGATK
jgi:hypothetical protein